MMKTAFFVLVILNVSYFLWQSQLGEELESSKQPQFAQGLTEQIYLLSEKPLPEKKEHIELTNEVTQSAVSEQQSEQTELSATEPEMEGQAETGAHSQTNLAETVSPTDMLRQDDSIAMDDKIVSQESENIPESVIESEPVVGAEVDEGSTPSDFVDFTRPVDQAPSSEQQANQNYSAAEQAATSESTQEEMQCLVIYGFSTQKQISRFLAKHQLTEDRVEMLPVIIESEKSYLVYYPAGENFAVSRENEKMLKAKGIEDLWLFRKGKLRGAISMGLFKRQSFAEKLVLELQEKNVNAIITTFESERESLGIKLENVEKDLQMARKLSAQNCY